MKHELVKQYLADFRAEFKALAVEMTLHKYDSNQGRKIASNPELVAFLCQVPASQMAIIWGVTSRTAIRRLEAIRHKNTISLCIDRRKYGVRKYRLSEAESLKCVHEAIEHWKKVGYSQTEIRPEIKEGATA